MNNYQIIKDGNVVQTISAKGLNSIHNQFNTYAKNRNAVQHDNNCLVCPFVWVLPSGSVLSLLRVEF